MSNEKSSQPEGFGEARKRINEAVHTGSILARVIDPRKSSALPPEFLGVVTMAFELARAVEALVSELEARDQFGETILAMVQRDAEGATSQ